MNQVRKLLFVIFSVFMSTQIVGCGIKGDLYAPKVEVDTALSPVVNELDKITTPTTETKVDE